MSTASTTHSDQYESANKDSVVSPLTYRKLSVFRSNRRGYWSFWIFLFVLVLSLFSELICNDRPFIVYQEGRLMFPVIIQYAETDFNGTLESEADYRDPYVRALIDDRGWALWPIVPFSYRTVDWELNGPVPSPPDRRHWLGTDDQARDVLARILYGIRISVLFGFALTLISAVIGVFIGAIQGYFGGWVDLLGSSQISGGCWLCCCCSPGWVTSVLFGQNFCVRVALTMSVPPRPWVSVIEKLFSGMYCLMHLSLP